MVELFNEGKPVDLVTLQDRLKEKDVPPEVCSLDFVRDIMDTVPTSANVRSYAQIVHDKAVLRRLIKINEGIANDCYAGKESLETILADTEKQIFALLQSRMSDGFVPIQQVALNVLDKIEQATRSRSVVTGLATGFVDLDYRTSGLQPSDLILIAARPSMGKTAFVLNIADYISVRRQKTCLIFSLEMSKEQLVNRMLAMEANVDSQKLRTGTLTDEDWDSVVEGIGAIGNSKLLIDDTPGISVMELRSKCRKGEAGVWAGSGDDRLSPADDGKRKKQRQPAAGDFGDFPFPKGACQGVKRAGDRPFSAFASLRDADGSQADAFGPAGIGSHRTGRGRGHVFVS